MSLFVSMIVSVSMSRSVSLSLYVRSTYRNCKFRNELCCSRVSFLLFSILFEENSRVIAKVVCERDFLISWAQR